MSHSPLAVRFWAIRCIGICLFIQLYLCRALWATDHPILPCAPFFPTFPLDFLTPLLPAFYGLLLLSLLCLIGWPQKRGLTYLCLGIGVLLVLQDLNRLQVWYYHLSCLLLLLSFWEHRQARELLFFAMIALYFWSGLHKLNIYFITDTFPWFFEKTGIFSSIGQSKVLAVAAAIAESAIGVGLFFKQSRKIAVITGLLFHLLILLLLGPFGHNWNEVVWPWNLTMMALLWLLFYKNPDQSTLSFRQMLWPFSALWIPFICLGILPGFNKIQAWDEALSFKMYAGTNPEAIFYFDKKEEACFPNRTLIDGAFQANAIPQLRFILDDVAFEHLKVPPYASERTFKQMAKSYCACLTHPETGGLEILSVNPWNNEEDNILKTSCLDLLGVN